MGFYNIFRMIRLILKDIFGYKTFRKILIIILLIFLLCFFYTKCFCASNDRTTVEFSPTNWNYTFTVNNPNNYYIIAYSYVGIWSNNVKDYHIGVVLSPTPFTIIETTPNYYKLSSDGMKVFQKYVRSPDGSLPPSSSFDNILNSLNTSIANSTSSFTTTSYDLVYSSSTYLENAEIFSYQDVYNTNNELIFNNSLYTPPSLGNSQSELQNLSFSNFIINANSYTQDIENNNGTLFMLFYNRSLSNSQSTSGLYPIKEKAFTKGSIYTDYENSTSDNMIFKFPIFMSGVFFNIGSTYEIRFAKQVYNSEYNTMVYEYLGEPIQFTISSNVTQDYINQLNQQTATTTDSEATQDLQNSINNQTDAINNQTQSIDNINNSITNSTVDNSSIDLPTDNTNDPTQSGVDNIFQTIYNSFTSGTAQNIVFPIPFTNKNITLQANYIYNMLQNNNASWIITIIQAFWWYLISRFIITDIMKKIRKIKQGNFDNIQNSNIKEDML